MKVLGAKLLKENEMREEYSLREVLISIFGSVSEGFNFKDLTFDLSTEISPNRKIIKGSYSIPFIDEFKPYFDGLDDVKPKRLIHLKEIQYLPGEAHLIHEVNNYYFVGGKRPDGTKFYEDAQFRSEDEMAEFVRAFDAIEIHHAAKEQFKEFTVDKAYMFNITGSDAIGTEKFNFVVDMNEESKFIHEFEGASKPVYTIYYDKAHQSVGIGLSSVKDNELSDIGYFKNKDLNWVFVISTEMSEFDAHITKTVREVVKNAKEQGLL